MQPLQLSEVEKAYYPALFRAADGDKDGVIGSADAGFFKRSNLPIQLLGQVWQQADSKQKGHLVEEEFYLALRLIALSQNGREPSAAAAQAPTFDLVPAIAEFPIPKALTTSAPVGVPSNPAAQPTLQQSQPPIVSSSPISPQDRQKYEEYFRQCDTNRDGFVTGEEAKVFFSKSGLPVQDLAKIWGLADRGNDRQLDLEEFCIAMFLISVKLRGGNIPDTLPPIFGPVQPQQQPLSQSGPTQVQPLAQVQPAPHAQVQSGPHAISPEDRANYLNIFRRADVTNTSFIDSEQSKKLFERSRLPNSDLGKIWFLSDEDKDGKLREAEFVVAMHLINAKLKGVEIPDVLPENLRQELAQGRAVAAKQSTGTPPVKARGNYNIDLSEISGVAPAPPPGASLVAYGTPVLLPSPRDMGAPTTPPSTGPTQVFVPPNGPAVAAELASVVRQPQPVAPTMANPPIQMPVYQSPAVAVHGPVTITPSLKSENQAAIMNMQQRIEELTPQLAQERVINGPLDEELKEQFAILDRLTAEVRELEAQVSHEKAKGQALKDNVKYARLQIQTMKSQKEQFEKILAEKREQFAEDSSLYQDLTQELSEKTSDLERQQEDIRRLTSDLENIRIRRKDVREKISSTKASQSELAPKKKQLEEEIRGASDFGSSPSFGAAPVSSGDTLRESSKSSRSSRDSSSSSKEKKERKEKKEKKERSSNRDSTYSATKESPVLPPKPPVAAETASPKVAPARPPKPAETFSPSSANAFGFNDDFGKDRGAFGDNVFGTSTFGEFDSGVSSFGVSSPQADRTADKKDDDPFAFTPDLKSADPSIDAQKDSFGQDFGNSSPFGKDAFAAKDDFGKEDFGASDFGSSEFGSSSFGQPALSTSSDNAFSSANFGSSFGESFNFGSGGDFSTPFGTSPSVPPKSQHPEIEKTSSSASGGFEGSFSFPTDGSQFDSGKDSFG
eukprot:TRINITY_DN1879_c0_g1_i1.p1 TRINITY_DN1879_c0_g1~~TRINITY_DN1879_c0_g1_i1.p1  ORF type:complete len:955 (-),score=261.57 TRINITY_DN1879_c0_g1_i1:46-2910(-)